MTVYELSREQLDELKERYLFCVDGMDYSDEYNSPEDVPDFVVQDWYNGINFVNDDFFCTAGMEVTQ